MPFSRIAGASDQVGLSSARGRTYAAAVSASASDSASQVDADAASAALRYLDERYTSASAAVRDGIDFVLDELESRSPGGFSKRSAASRRELLATWSSGPGGTPRLPSTPARVASAGCDAEVDGSCPPLEVHQTPDGPQRWKPTDAELTSWLAAKTQDLVALPFYPDPSEFGQSAG
jgi:hypothetical protein